MVPSDQTPDRAPDEPSGQTADQGPGQPPGGAGSLPATAPDRAEDHTEERRSEDAVVPERQAQRIREEVAAQVLDSDPGGNSPHGLAGDLGVSSEWTGDRVGSPVTSTHDAEPVLSEPVEDPPPEQSPDPDVGGPETPTPEDPADYRAHHFDPDAAQPHSHG